MKHPKANPMAPLIVATSLALAAHPAWSQTTDGVSEAVLKRIDALAQEIEQLKAQLKASETRAQSPAPEPAAARLAAAPATEAGAASAVEGEAEGLDVVRNNRATLNFYGMIDIGAERIFGTLANGDSAEAVRVSNGIITPHFGVRGTGALAGGWRGSFHLEGSFASDHGTSGIGGRLFGRQAWAAISGPYGTLRGGRQYTMVRMGWEDANPYGTGNQGLRLLDPRISNPRADNSISYLGKWGPVSAGLNYSSGWDAVNGNSSNTGPANNAGANCPGEIPNAENQCKALSAGIKYNGGAWGIATSWERLRGGTNNTFGGLNTPERSDRRVVLGAYYTLKGGAKLTAGWIQRENEGNVATPKSNLYWAEAIVPVGGPWYVDGLVARLKYEDSVNQATLFNLRGRYVLTKDTTLYMTAAFMDNEGTLALPASASTPAPTPQAGAKQKSVIAGVLYRF
ncbi:porin [Pseudorhodoferax sp.]|uniref:porin n=1 Tax=Pseudorhodoferax sp. TaxID=1993553 RepID=UPI002DD6B7DE|nr:porin [Pseudorhodoferax sp.]